MPFLWDFVPPCFADRGKDFTCYPTLKTFRALQLAPEDEGVHTGFVDDGLIWIARCSVVKRDGILILIVNVFSKCITGIAIPQCRCNILTNKPRFAVDGNSSDFAVIIYLFSEINFLNLQLIQLQLVVFFIFIFREYCKTPLKFFLLLRNAN